MNITEIFSNMSNNKQQKEKKVKESMDQTTLKPDEFRKNLSEKLDGIMNGLDESLEGSKLKLEEISTLLKQFNENYSSIDYKEENNSHKRK